LIEVDTVYLSSNLIFEAKDKSYKSYEWVIGSDVNHRYGNTISIDFVFSSEETIPITLIVQGSSDKNCQNKVDFRDTLTKFVHFIPYTKFRLKGTYSGSFTNNPNGIFEIKINTGVDGSKGYITGLPISSNQQPPWFGDTAVRIEGLANTFAIFDNGDSRNRPEGIVTFDSKKNELTLEYYIIEPFPIPSGQN